MINDLLQSKLKGSRHIEWVAYISILAGSLFYCYETILRVAPSAVNGELMAYFKLANDKTSYDLLNSYYYFIYAPMQLVVGLLVDRYGPKRWLMLACLLCGLGTYLYVADPSMLWVSCLGRFLVGFGSSFAFIGVLKLASIWLPVNRFALVAGCCVTLGQLGAFGVDHYLPGIVEFFGSASSSSPDGVFPAFSVLAVLGVAVFFIVTVFIRDESSDKQCRKNLSNNLAQLGRGLNRLIHKKDLWLICVIGLLMWMPLVLFAENLGKDFIYKMYGLKHVAKDIVGSFFLGWAVGAPLVNYYSNVITSRKKPMLIGSIAALIVFFVIWYGIPNMIQFEGFINAFWPVIIAALLTAVLSWLKIKSNWAKITMVALCAVAVIWSIAQPGSLLLNQEDCLSSVLFVLVFGFGFVSSVQVIVFAAAKELSCPNTSGTATSITNMVTMFSGFIPMFCNYIAAWSPNYVSNMEFGNQHISVMQYYLFPVIIAIAISILCSFFMKETYVEAGFANDEDDDS
ncbi:MAG: MFS transporter [Candidatus Comchoanobacterales bacterium]